ncbi:hypothetical protein TEA_008312 [Camellia sinensis var. sinensis]|uniref:Uncharacterized protein n=1 Tax=Camellia sinensis var. sinensis TaxID=542762 RepID=A0A4S4ESD8_CAMSN|nr:hypothetical protein TEA_008312 [Camellia sinensis var. sinensis]
MKRRMTKSILLLLTSEQTFVQQKILFLPFPLFGSSESSPFFIVWECEDDSPPSIVRIPKSYIANSAIPMIPLPKGEGKSSNKKKAMEDSRPNIRSSPIPRPRAVLSSPVNDGVIGGRNKAKIEVLSGLKDHNLRQTRHTQCKVIPRRSTVETPITTKRESKEAADGKTDLEQKKGSAKANPRQRADLRKGKFDSV